MWGCCFADDVDDDDDCVVLDGDPHRPVSVEGAKGRSDGVGASDEVEILTVRYLNSELLPFLSN